MNDYKEELQTIVKENFSINSKSDESTLTGQ
jgi:hypothetical protein